MLHLGGFNKNKKYRFIHSKIKTSTYVKAKQKKYNFYYIT